MSREKHNITILQTPGFKRTYKKLHPKIKSKVNEAIQSIVNEPELGEEKKGDLKGIFVYKFKITQQQYLLAYEWDPKKRLLLALGVHEDFYRNLKKKLN